MLFNPNNKQPNRSVFLLGWVSFRVRHFWAFCLRKVIALKILNFLNCLSIYQSFRQNSKRIFSLSFSIRHFFGSEEKSNVLRFDSSQETANFSLWIETRRHIWNVASAIKFNYKGERNMFIPRSVSFIHLAMFNFRLSWMIAVDLSK